jgi:ribonuclease P protein component
MPARVVVQNTVNAPAPPRFPRRAHLRAASEFQAVFSEGRRLSGAVLRLHVRLAPAPAAAIAAPDDVADAAAPGSASGPASRADAPPSAPLPPIARLGITVSKRVDKRAVGRNRVRRQIRETFRLARATLPPGDYVVLAKPEAAKADNAALRRELGSLLLRAATLAPMTCSTSAPLGTMPPAFDSDRRPPSAS